jgi:hypothetical protein
MDFLHFFFNEERILHDLFLLLVRVNGKVQQLFVVFFKPGEIKTLQLYV